MISYQDLTRKFVEFDNAREQYWERLHLAASQLTNELANSLNMPSNSYKDFDGKEHPYISLGYYEHGEFKATHARMIPGGDDLTLRFAIKIVLERAPNEFPKQAFATTIALREKDNKVEINLGESDVVLTTITDAADGRFVQVVEAIKQSILNTCDPTYFD